MLACLRNSISRRTNSGVRGVFAGFHSSSVRQDKGQDGLGALGRDVAANPGTATNYVHNPDSRYRSFSANEVIQPWRLSYEAVVKRRALPITRSQLGPSKKEAQFKDPFYQLGVDPLKQAMNPAMLNPFISEMGKVYSRAHTNLTKKNQRRMGKAIRRAKMMGIIPILSRRNIFSPISSR